MFKKTTIRSKVLSAINEKIDLIEDEYQSDVDDLTRKFEDDKEALLDEHVNGLLTKILN